MSNLESSAPVSQTTETREPATHDLTRGTGVEVCWSAVPDGGLQIQCYGWTDKPLAVGDYLILAPRGAQDVTTRYRLVEFRRPGDPDDMWFGLADFAPRFVDDSKSGVVPTDGRRDT